MRNETWTLRVKCTSAKSFSGPIITSENLITNLADMLDDFTLGASQPEDEAATKLAAARMQCALDNPEGCVMCEG
jgi:hypothetical protein